MKTWIVRFAALYVFNVALLVIDGSRRRGSACMRSGHR